MFNLGYKEVILNNLDGVHVDPTDTTSIIIEGFGKFKKTDLVAGALPVSPVGEVAMWILPTMTGDYADVKVSLQEIHTDKKETLYYVAKTPTEADIVAGFINWKEKYDKMNSSVEISAGLTTEIQPGFEKFYVHDIFIRPGKYDEIDTAHKEYVLTKSVATEGNPGVGQGWQIEASRKLGTFTNSYPYGQHHGGNSTGVDLNAGYKEYNVVIPESVNAGWEKAEFIDSNTVNAEVNSKDFKFVLYVHEDFITAFEAL
jgi:hypothetical protein